MKLAITCRILLKGDSLKKINYNRIHLMMTVHFCIGALSWYGKLTWESAHAWNLITLCLLIVWGYDSYIYGAFEFLCNSIANL